jgi:hypothetical protein
MGLRILVFSHSQEMLLVMKILKWDILYVVGVMNLLFQQLGQCA